MNTKQIKLIGTAIFGLFLIGLTAPAVFAKITATLSASVVSQECAGGNGVNVTLTATLQPNKPNVRYEWDFNNDGIFDTAPNTNPMASNVYPDEVRVTARVRATKGSRSAESTVTFQTLRCP
jgi:uncharacterized protein (DUF58 family)